MKTLLTAVAAFTVGGAAAQSSVTLYGVFEGGIAGVSNVAGGHLVQSVTGGNNGSRLGFRGTERLGGSLYAFFQLEQGVDTSKGSFLQGGLPFGRGSWVGLGGDLGRISAGRQISAASSYLYPIASTANWNRMGQHGGDFDNIMSGYIDNSLKYVSPKIGGFEAMALYGFGEQANAFNVSSTRAFGLQYQEGPLRAAVIYENINNPSRTIYQGTTNPGTTGYTSPVRVPIYSGYASAEMLKITGVGAAYSFGALTVGAVHTRTKFQNIRYSATTPNTGDASFSNTELNARYLMGQIEPAIAVDRTTAPGAHYNQYRAGVNYHFSKRTMVQFVVAKQTASGKNSLGLPAVAAVGPFLASSTSSQTGVKLSLRHSL